MVRVLLLLLCSMQLPRLTVADFAMTVLEKLLHGDRDAPGSSRDSDWQPTSLEWQSTSSEWQPTSSEWQPWQECAAGTYAVGQHMGDAEAWQSSRIDFTSIGLYCRPYSWESADNTTAVYSRKFWNSRKRWCSRRQVIIGFQVRRETKSQANLTTICAEPHVDRLSIQENADKISSGLTMENYCPEGEAVCGVRLETRNIKLDNDELLTGINDIDLRCCRVEIECEPAADFVTLHSVDNRNGSGVMTYEYTVRSSFTQTTSRTSTLSHNEKKLVAGKIIGQLGVSEWVPFVEVSVAGEIGMERAEERTRALQDLLEQAVEHTVEKKLVVSIPAGRAATIKQLQFRCGSYRVGVAKTINEQNTSSSGLSILSLCIAILVASCRSIQ